MPRVWLFKQLMGRVDVHKAEVKSTPKATQRTVTVRRCQKICTSLEIQQKLVKPIIKKWKKNGTYSHSEGVYSFSGSDGLCMELHQSKLFGRVKGGIQRHEGDHSQLEDGYLV